MTLKRYLRFTNHKLKEMCNQRKLAVSGPKQKKAQRLLERLLAWDAQQSVMTINLSSKEVRHANDLTALFAF